MLPKDDFLALNQETVSIETAEKVAFDKADEAEKLEALSVEHQKLLADIQALECKIATAIEPRRSHLEAELLELHTQAYEMARRIDTSAG